MKRINRKLLAIGILLGGAGLGVTSRGCVTNPTTGEVSVDWPAVSTELRLASADVKDLARLVEDPELGADLIELGALAEHAADVIDGADDGSDPRVVFQAAITVAERVAGESDDQDTQLVVLTLTSVLRRVQAYWPAR